MFRPKGASISGCSTICCRKRVTRPRRKAFLPCGVRCLFLLRRDRNQNQSGQQLGFMRLPWEAGQRRENLRMGMRMVTLTLVSLDPSQAGAGVVQVVVFLGEAEAEEVFSVAGAIEGGAGDRGYAGCGQQVAGFLGGGLAGEMSGAG